VLVLKRWRALRKMVLGGDLGFAEAYIDGDWSSPDLAALIELASRNGPTIDDSILPSWPVRLANRLLHRWRDNTRLGSRRNIMAHYDLGNDFYECWLDRGMSYSSALYAHPEQSLEDAQTAKQDRILELLDLKGGETVLEIGCGWGGLAERLVTHGASVTGLTLSPAQLDYARRRLAPHSDRAALRLQDYRDTQGTFDRVVSIEMLEAVGRRFWPTYFARLRERLARGGVAVLQVITIEEWRFESYQHNVDFIQRYVFPGGMLPSPQVLRRHIAEAGLVLTGAETFGESYGRTLAAWRQRFNDAWPTIEAMGFSGSFRRLWDYYLCYCEAGFRTGAIDVGLYRLTHAPEG
jgi:cyclopropane-fatty-acyl-phospholipid synthase